MGSFMGRGNDYIQLVKVLYCKLRVSNYQLSHLRSGRDSNFDLRGRRQECYHSATVAPLLACYSTVCITIVLVFNTIVMRKI